MKLGSDVFGEMIKRFSRPKLPYPRRLQLNEGRLLGSLARKRSGGSRPNYFRPFRMTEGSSGSMPHTTGRHLFFFCSYNFRIFLLSSPPLEPRLAIACPKRRYALPNQHTRPTRNPRQLSPLRRPHPFRPPLPIACSARQPAVSHARGQGQRCAARQSQCVEAWDAVRLDPVDRPLSARHQPRCDGSAGRGVRRGGRHGPHRIGAEREK